MSKRIVGAIICMVLIMSTFALAATVKEYGPYNYRNQKYSKYYVAGDSSFKAEGLLVNENGCNTTGGNLGTSTCYMFAITQLTNKYDGETYTTRSTSAVVPGGTLTATRDRFYASVYATYTHKMSRFDCTTLAQALPTKLTEQFTFVNDQE